jgi:hypothetical protein
MKIIAIILIAVGAIGLTYGVISFTRKEKIVDMGSVQITADKKESFIVSPWLGGGVVVAGVALLLFSTRK